MAPKLLLVDASSSIFRAFFAIPALATSAGVPTNATLGFTTMLQKLLRESTPDCVAVVWDAPGPKRRKELSADYKATRNAAPEDLIAQFSWIRRIVDAYRMATVEYPGEEADDVIATIARAAEREGFSVEIASTDKDLLQLVSPTVSVVDTMRDRRFGPAEVEARFGVPPAQMLDLRALVGDSSDNIPGVKGIGEKGAAELLRTHGSLDALLANPDAIAGKRAREALRAGSADAQLSRELSRLREDLPIAFDREVDGGARARPAHAGGAVSRARAASGCSSSSATRRRRARSRRRLRSTSRSPTRPKRWRAPRRSSRRPARSRSSSRSSPNRRCAASSSRWRSPPSPGRRCSSRSAARVTRRSKRSDPCSKTRSACSWAAG